ncbi:MAG: ATP-binding cassette domain-containing protein [Spirochaetaceae bacterium]|jgi:ATPase subunit of ABC transporter with duplicated ATPase domains|nr:ATP-binding cassette domain-containing protein [Spirochaetaceae bacterium]
MSTSFLSINNLTFSWPQSLNPVISGLTVQFSSGWSAITGPNGGGKTTLLKLVCGLLEPESGSISRPSSDSKEIAVYCPQNTDAMPEGWETAFGNFDGNIGKILALLEIGDDWLFRWETLSGGEKKRLQLAAALCMEPLVLALDEPTNHLDTHSRTCIINALKAFGEHGSGERSSQGIGLVVSHDRELMDALCHATLFLAPNEAKLYPGGAAKALELRDAERKAGESSWQKAEGALKKERDLVQRQNEEVSRTKGRLSLSGLDPRDSSERAKIKAAILTGKDAVAANAKSRANTRASQAEEKLKNIDRPQYRKEGVSIQTEVIKRAVILRLPAGDISAGDYRFTIPELVITPASRIALTGNNGTGKTTLVSHLISRLPKEEILYLPQEIPQEESARILSLMAEMDNTKRAAVLSSFYRLGGTTESAVSTSQEHKTVSPGELRKLLIAEALTRPLSLIIMDEPTNHMDITSVLILENALKESGCPLLLVSHDRVFLEKLTNEHWILERNENRGILRIEKG